ncbi:putative DJ-1/PfpI domain-containing protein [Seiridium cardinale]|uniref:DJ-1/PfpI domain-containing protein n=1 Tax=Seiridium cardinale TaxID=138064 RepID=A0ABR2X7U3_9PEZI
MGAPRKAIRLGVFVPTECQLLDASCVDIIASMSYEYMSLLADILPKAIIDMAPSVIIHYISSVKPGETFNMTANHKVVATNHYSDDEVAPGKLDIVIVPGPDPRTEFEEQSLEWLRRQGASPSTDILSVCTGIFVCGHAGLLQGKTVCGPRLMQDAIRSKFGKDIVQKGAELRWVQDGNFWSSGQYMNSEPFFACFLPLLVWDNLFDTPSLAFVLSSRYSGVTNGNDLVAAYARHKSEFFPRPLVETALDMTDTGDRAQVYAKSQSTAILGLAMNAFRAWLSGFWRK